MMLVRRIQNYIEITVNGEILDRVHQFTYLGSILADDSDTKANVACRIDKDSATFQKIRENWSSCEIDRIPPKMHA